MKPEQCLSPDKRFVVEPLGSCQGLLVSAVVTSGRGLVPLSVINDTDRYVTLKPGCHVANATEAYQCEMACAAPDGFMMIRQLEGVSECDMQQQLDKVKQLMPSHLKDLFSRSVVGLTLDRAAKVGVLLISYEDIFARHDLDIGCLEEVQHRINTGDSPPVRQKMRRTPFGFEAEERKHLQTLLDAGVIQPSESDWASAPVLVRKKDGSVRWCIDYRALNDKTVKDSFPLPNIEDCLEALAGTQYFSTLDMASGYYQICMAPEDRKKTAFVTKYGLFEHKRMGFGLCNAPATFQRAVQLVFRGLLWNSLLAYLDDINVLGRDFEDALTNLEDTFERVRQYHIKLKPKKCFLLRTELEFLGKLVTRSGVKVSPKKIDAVVKWPNPVNKKELQSFLGFVNYHRDHIQGYAGIAQPLYELTGKVPFQWTKAHQRAFQRLKDLLVSAPCLSYPQPGKTFVLDTDASDVSIGAELSQLQEGKVRVIAYASHVLQPAQRRYCVTRKELLAVVKFCRQFRHFLLGQPFIVRTDHSSLVWLWRFRHLEGQLARWVEELAQYDMKIIHRSGKHHNNADGLSRIPDPEFSCDCYSAGRDLDSLPCGGCAFCRRAHEPPSVVNP